MLNQYTHGEAKDTYTKASLTSKTPTHTQNQESVPSLLHSPSGPEFPCQCSFGVVEKKASHLNLFVWLPNLGFSRIANLQSHSTQSEDQPLDTCSKTINSQLCEENQRKQGDNPKMVNVAQAKQGDLELFLALSWPKQLEINPKDTCTHSNPKPGEEQQPQSHNETMVALHSMQMGEKTNSQH